MSVDFLALKDVLGELLLLSPEEREQRLDAIGRRDAQLKAALDEWLIEERLAGDFLEDATGVAPSPILEPGTLLGGFRIRRVLGIGGMSVVYEAEQSRPLRLVALKVLRPEFATDEARQRFEQESELLAKLQDPAIATIHAVSSAMGPDRVPYIAMELVQDANPFPTDIPHEPWEARRRLRLFLELCRAMGHAHSRGVLHRDLKPQNVLIDRHGQIRIIDFGIGKSLETTAPRLTLHGDLMGTPAFMSPEQRDDNGKDAVGPPSDVYALGVMLVLSQCGESPRIGLLPPAFERHAPRDLQAIAAKALDEDPRHRYSTASSLAHDIHAYLNDLPIAARVPRIHERALRLARRHRATTRFGVVMLILVMIASLAFLIQARAHEASELRGRSNKADVTSFLQSVLSLANPRESSKHNPALESVLKSAGDRVDVELEDDFEARAEIHATLGRTWLDLGRHDEAIEHLESAVSLYDRADGPPFAAGGTRNALADAYHAAGRDERARDILLEGLGHLRREDAPAVFVAIAESKLARSLATLGESLHRAEPLARAALETYRTLIGENHEATVAGHSILATVLAASGKREEARIHARQALRIQLDLNPEGLDAARAHDLLASLLPAVGEEAKRHGERALELFDQCVSEDHPERRAAASRIRETQSAISSDTSDH